MDQWFAPKPFTTKTKSMIFREGGHWHYAMIDPEGEEYWGYFEYRTIRPIDTYKGLDSFCDESGAINADLPSQTWNVTFIDASEHTIVHTLLSYDSLADLEQVIEMGFKDGMTATLERLDELLTVLDK